MPKYTFCIEATITLHTEVTAKTFQDAVKIAAARRPMGLCHQCSYGEPRCWNTSGELDCDPPNSPLTELLVDGEEMDIDAANEEWKKQQ